MADPLDTVGFDNDRWSYVIDIDDVRVWFHSAQDNDDDIDLFDDFDGDDRCAVIVDPGFDADDLQRAMDKVGIHT